MKIDIKKVSLIISAGYTSQFPKDKRKAVIFSGRSNVGKSSLINSLVCKKGFAHVSSTPGKTVTVNFYDIDGKMYFIDLPGYGFAKRSYDKKSDFSTLTDGFLTGRDDASRDLYVQLVDMKVGETNDDLTMLDWLERTGKNYIVVATKSDKLNKTDFIKSLEALKTKYKTVIPYSSLNGNGREELAKLICDFAE